MAIYALAGNAEKRHYYYIHLRMAKDPEEVLVEQNVTARANVIEDGVEIPVAKQHSYDSCKDRDHYRNHLTREQ
jgi:hypothetical protein